MEIFVENRVSVAGTMKRGEEIMGMHEAQLLTCVKLAGLTSGYGEVST